jgi:hypothetical protein
VGLGLLCVVPLWPFGLGGKKVPSIFGIEIHLIHELNLCLSITTGSISIVVTVLLLR